MKRRGDMSFKILEQNGVDNENVDGGAFNNFAAGGRDGIVGGVLSECALIAAGSAIGIAPGLIVLHGIRVKVTGIETLSLSSVPLRPTSYQIVAQVTLASNGDVDFSFFIRTPQPLVQNSLYQNSAGTYQAELASFTHNPDGTISDLMKTLDVIYGAGGGDVNIEVGTVTTETLAAGLDADFDVSVRREEGTNKVLLDFDAKIPRGASGTDDEAVHFTPQALTEPQQTQAQKNMGIGLSYEQLEDGTYNLIIGLTGDAPSAAAITQINGEDLAGKEFYEYVRTEGAVLFSFNPDFSPAARYGGSWENITDRFLIGAGGSYALDSTGGANYHSHEQNLYALIDGTSAGGLVMNTFQVPSYDITFQVSTNGSGSYVDKQQNGFATRIYGEINMAQNIPPYIACNIWRKVA